MREGLWKDLWGKRNLLVRARARGSVYNTPAYRVVHASEANEGPS